MSYPRHHSPHDVQQQAEYLSGAPTLYGPGAGYYQQPPVQHGILYSPSPSGSAKPLPLSLSQSQQQPLYTLQQQPVYTSQHQPAYASQHQPAYTSQHQPAYTSQHQPAYALQQQPVRASQHQPAHASQQQPAHTSQHLLQAPPASHGMYMSVTPPTPVEKSRQKAEDVKTRSPSPSLPLASLLTTVDKGKQRAEDIETRAPSPSSSLLQASVPPNRAEKGKGRAVDVDSGVHRSIFAASSPLPASVDDTPAADSDDDSDVRSATDSPTSSRGSASGRWSDGTIAAAAIVYKEMDELLNSFCTAHDILFSRAFKKYLKGHSEKAPGENPWNTYTKLHAHKDHKERELARVGYTIEGFNLLDSEEQQKLRAQCWKEFQQSFNSPAEYNASLDVFRQFNTSDVKAKGISIGKRRKFFDNLLNKLARVVRYNTLSYTISLLTHLSTG